MTSSSAELEALCVGCDYVATWLDQELADVTDAALLDELVSFRAWLRTEWVRLANELEQARMAS